VNTIASNAGTQGWTGLYSVSKTTEDGEQYLASLKRAPGVFTHIMDAIRDADSAARAFIAGLSEPHTPVTAGRGETDEV
jgi:hypothetical protein